MGEHPHGDRNPRDITCHNGFLVLVLLVMVVIIIIVIVIARQDITCHNRC